MLEESGQRRDWLQRLEPKDRALRPVLERDLRVLFRMLYGPLGLSKFQLERGVETVLDSVNKPHALLKVLQTPQTRHFVYAVPLYGEDPFNPEFQWNEKMLTDHPDLELLNDNWIPLAAALDETKENRSFVPGSETDEGLLVPELGRRNMGRLQQSRHLPQDIEGLPHQRRLHRRLGQDELGQKRWEKRRLELEQEGSWLEPHREKKIPWKVPEEKLTPDALRKQVQRIDAWFHFRTEGQTPSLAIAVLIGAALDPQTPLPLDEGLETWMRLVTEIRRVDEETQELASGWIGDMIFVKGLSQLLPELDDRHGNSNYILAAAQGRKIGELAFGTFVMVAAQLTKRPNIRVGWERTAGRRRMNSIFFLAAEEGTRVCRERPEYSAVLDAVIGLKAKFRGKFQHYSRVEGYLIMHDATQEWFVVTIREEDRNFLNKALGSVNLHRGRLSSQRHDTNWDRYALALDVLWNCANPILIVDTAFNIASLPAAGPREWFQELMRLDRVWYCDWVDMIFIPVARLQGYSQWEDDWAEKVESGAFLSTPLEVENPEDMLIQLRIPEDAEFPEQQRAADRNWVADAQAEERRWLEAHQRRLENFPWGQEERWDELNPARRQQDEERAWQEPILHPQGFYAFFPPPPGSFAQEEGEREGGEGEGWSESDFYTLLDQHRRSQHR